MRAASTQLKAKRAPTTRKKKEEGAITKAIKKEAKALRAIMTVLRSTKGRKASTTKEGGVNTKGTTKVETSMPKRGVKAPPSARTAPKEEKKEKKNNQGPSQLFITHNAAGVLSFFLDSNLS